MPFFISWSSLNSIYHSQWLHAMHEDLIVNWGFLPDLLKPLLFLTLIYYVYPCVHMYGQGTIYGSLFSFHHIVSRGQTQLRLGGKCPYLLSHPAHPVNSFFRVFVVWSRLASNSLPFCLSLLFTGINRQAISAKPGLISFLWTLFGISPV